MSYFIGDERKNCNTAFSKQLEGTSPNHSYQSAAVLQKQNSERTLKTARCEEVLVSMGKGCSKIRLLLLFIFRENIKGTGSQGCLLPQSHCMSCVKQRPKSEEPGKIRSEAMNQN